MKLSQVFMHLFFPQLNMVEAECDAFDKAQSSSLNELQSAVSSSLDFLTQTHTSCVDTLQSSVAVSKAHSQVNPFH